MTSPAVEASVFFQKNNEKEVLNAKRGMLGSLAKKGKNKFFDLLEKLQRNDPYTECLCIPITELRNKAVYQLGNALLNKNTRVWDLVIMLFDLKDESELAFVDRYLEPLLSFIQSSNSGLTKVTLCGPVLSEAACPSITSKFLHAIAKNPNIKDVRINNCNVSTRSLSVLLRETNSVTKLRLDSCPIHIGEQVIFPEEDISPERNDDSSQSSSSLVESDAEELAVAFAENTSLESLTLLNCLSDPVFLAPILLRLSVASTASKFKHLALLGMESGISTSPTIANALRQFVEHAKSFEHLETSGVKFHGTASECWDCIAEGICCRTEINHLKPIKLGFQSCLFDTQSGKKLENLLIGSSNDFRMKKKQKHSRNSVDSKTMHCNGCISSLVLRGRVEFGSETARIISNALQYSSTLRELELVSVNENSLPAYDYATIFKALETNRKLERLVIHPIKRFAQYKAMIRSLPKLRHLKEIDIVLHCDTLIPKIRQQVRNEFRGAFQRNSSLEVVCMSFRGDNVLFDGKDIIKIQRYCIRNQEIRKRMTRIVTACDEDVKRIDCDTNETADEIAVGLWPNIFERTLDCEHGLDLLYSGIQTIVGHAI